MHSAPSLLDEDRREEEEFASRKLLPKRARPSTRTGELLVGGVFFYSWSNGKRLNFLLFNSRLLNARIVYVRAFAAVALVLSACCT